MIIYIAGPISNNPNYKEDFKKVRKEFEAEGHTVLDPSFLPKGFKQKEYMSVCIPMLALADTIYLLKGWEKSEGARIEYALAKQDKKVVIYGE